VKCAFVFPGQGSQSVGMQASLAAAFPAVTETYAEASSLLGFDLWQLVQQGPQEKLDQTVVTQPAMLTAGVAAWRCWQAAGGPAPVAAAGHSLGEFTALVCSGALDFAEAVALVKRRARLMQEAVPGGSGAMAAILGLDDQLVMDVCAAAAQGQVVSAVNFNSPGQVVIAGERDAVGRAAENARAAGAKRAMLLSVSVPSHCALMEPAAAELAKRLEQTAFLEPAFPVISNVDVAPYRNAADIRDGLRRQLFSPVRWMETVQVMAGRGVDVMIECGPGKVLVGLLKRIDRALAGGAIENTESLQAALELCGVQDGATR